VTKTINNVTVVFRYGPLITTIQIMNRKATIHGYFFADMTISSNCIDPVWNDTVLFCRLITGSTINVTVNGTFSGIDFQYPVSTVDSVIFIDNKLVITGNNFGEYPTANCTILSANDTLVICLPDANPVRVSYSNSFKVIPVINSITPLRINSTGKTFDLTGIALLDTLVTNGPCRILSSNYTRITCNCSSGTGQQIVTINDNPFLIRYGPSITQTNVDDRHMYLIGKYSLDTILVV
jgi:hypothetical protein